MGFLGFGWRHICAAKGTKVLHGGEFTNLRGDDD